MSEHKILVVARGAVREWLEIVLREEQFEVLSAEDGCRGMELFEANRPDLVIGDLALPEPDGIKVLQAVKDADPATPVIMMTAGEDLRLIIEAMERGAYDCVEKPIEICKLQRAIARCLNIKQPQCENSDVKCSLANGSDISHIVVGKSPGMREVHRKMRLISSRRTNALIQGEYGTGKVLICRVIHDSGVTRGHPFVAVDVPALPELQLERVLFGQVKELHSGRMKDGRGLFEIAGAGTLLLNEISEISPDIQEKLLRVLQEKEFKPVGAGTSVPMKARTIGVTKKNLGEMVRAGKFREDLFYRIAVCSITVPPLRERREDIPPLVVHLLRRINRELHKNVNRIPGEAIEVLKNREWAGNVRELVTVLTRAVVEADGDVLQEKYLKSQYVGRQRFSMEPRKQGLNSAEKDRIKDVLDETNWDKRKAARLLNISRQTLYNKIKMYRIVP